MGGSPYYETAPELLFVSLFALVGFAPSFSGRPLVLRIARCAAFLAAFSHGGAFFVRHALPTLAKGLALLFRHVLRTPTHFVAVPAIPTTCLITLGPSRGAFLVAHALPLSTTRIALSLSGLICDLTIIFGFLRLGAAKDKQAGAYQ